MTGRVVDLAARRWLELANLAMAAAAEPGADAQPLLIAAGRMVTATPPSTAPFAMAQCLSFRWACTAFRWATPADRVALAPALKIQAEVIRRLFDHHPAPPEAVSMPVPVQPSVLGPEEYLPGWARRADIGG